MNLLRCLLIFCLTGCSADVPESAPAQSSAPDTDTSIQSLPFEKFTLPNGLDVILHLDRSDPVVAVVLTAHVGSARELPGLTGFAHLFEHLLFLESENLGKGGLDAMSARIGGSGANGSTNRDRTNYLQTVPKDALEKMLWAEAEKLGWFINTVTEPVLAKEKQVVKNEKRQSYDNRPYGHTSTVISNALYPAGHPYSWEVIGSLDDIQRASLDDVKDFYRRWYTPDNVTLSIAGDFDPAEARAWVERYFSEIPAGPGIEAMPPSTAELTQIRSLFHEDNYAQLPELTLVWPTVPQHHPDSYALDVLAGLLSEGKNAPLNTVLVDEQQLAGSVSFEGYQSELAGELYLSVRAFEGMDLDAVRAAVDAGFARFEQDGIAARDLQRIKTLLELAHYDQMATVLGKAVALGELDAVYGRPELLNDMLAAVQGVTAEDVLRVYNTYVRNQPHIATSFVPRGMPELALTGAERAAVVEEPIVAGVEESFDAGLAADYLRTPSTFDRSIEPPYGAAPLPKLPEPWRATLTNGLRVLGITDNELPLVQFELAFEGGQLLELADKSGVANFVAEVLDKGTTRLGTAELEEELALLGATLQVRATAERFSLRGRTLARNLEATLALVTEVLLQPRWDASEIELARARITSELQDALASPLALVDQAWNQVLYGPDHVFARNLRGTLDSVATISAADLQAYHELALAPGNASLRLAGAVDVEAVPGIANLLQDWNKTAPVLPQVAAPALPDTSRVYFVDVPGAAQSVFRFGRPGPLRTDPDYDAVQVLNYRLGGGGFASQLTQELRESKGYTYGISSRFSGSARQGQFQVASSVRSNVTLEAATLIRDLTGNFGTGFTEEDLALSRSFLQKSQARAFESLDAKLNMLGEIADYGLPDDYVLRRGELAATLSVADLRELAGRYLRSDAMHYVIVGDAATQLENLQALGFGEVLLLGQR